MSQVTFKHADGSEQKLSGQLPQTKILSVALKGKVKIRFGCSSCRCGTCGIKVLEPEALLPMGKDEQALLERMGLETNTGQIRLACRSRLTGERDVTVDIGFQEQYNPDGGSNQGAL
jgi:ferredoxin